MQCLDTYKTEPLLLTIREAMRRYGFSEPSGFRKFCRHLAIPSPDQAPFPVPHIEKMDECWVARNLPYLKLSRKQYKAMVLATGQDLRKAVRNNFRCEIEDLIKQSPAEFRTHPITQDYLDRIYSEDYRHGR